MKLRALWPSRPMNKVKNQLPRTAPNMKLYYEIYILIADICQPFGGLVVKMLVKPHLKLVSSCQYCRYAAKQQGLAPLILLSKVVDFFGSKASYMCLLYPTGCKIRSDEFFSNPPL